MNIQAKTSRDVSLTFNNAYRVLRAQAYSCFEKYDIIPTHWSLLGLVYDAETGITLSDVANALGVKLPLVTVMVDYLESKDLLSREANPEDGRSKLLVPTEYGKRRIVVIEDDISRTFAPLFQDITPQQFDTFYSVLKTIADSETQPTYE